MGFRASGVQGVRLRLRQLMSLKEDFVAVCRSRNHCYGNGSDIPIPKAFINPKGRRTDNGQDLRVACSVSSFQPVHTQRFGFRV